MSENQETLYIELNEWDAADCSHFVREAILPLLDAPRRLTISEAASTVAAWLEDLDASVTLVADSSIDFDLLRELLYVAGIPMPQVIAGAQVFSPSVAGEIAREKFFACALRRHHALDDAKALLASWRQTNG